MGGVIAMVTVASVCDWDGPLTERDLLPLDIVPTLPSFDGSASGMGTPVTAKRTPKTLVGCLGVW